MQINTRVYNETLYANIIGELDQHSAQYARLTLDESLNNTVFKQVIVDLSELQFMDSTGIGVLIGRYKKLKEKHIPIFICNPSTHADKIFKMTKMYELMPKIN